MDERTNPLFTCCFSSITTICALHMLLQLHYDSTNATLLHDQNQQRAKSQHSEDSNDQRRSIAPHSSRNKKHHLAGSSNGIFPSLVVVHSIWPGPVCWTAVHGLEQSTSSAWKQSDKAYQQRGRSGCLCTLSFYHEPLQQMQCTDDSVTS